MIWHVAYTIELQQPHWWYSNVRLLTPNDLIFIMLEFALFFMLLFFQLPQILSLPMKPLVPHSSPSCAVCAAAFSDYGFPFLYWNVILKMLADGLLICLFGLLPFKRKAQIHSLSYSTINSHLSKLITRVRNQELTDLLACFVFVSPSSSICCYLSHWGDSISTLFSTN